MDAANRVCYGNRVRKGHFRQCAFSNQLVQGVVMISRMIPKVNLILFTLIILVFNILFVNPVGAQVAGATLTGTVTDPSGGLIPHAQITITDVATGIMDGKICRLETL
jgi:hypothetical protein